MNGARRRWKLRFAIATIVATASAATTSTAVADDVAWEWSPYRVQIAWQVVDGPQWTERLTAEAREAAERRLAERFGAAWHFADADDDDDVDKRFEVRLAYERGAYVVEVREWDAIAD